ncbi:MAG: ATP-grasp domain-containing protein [Gammaproteobacteria bacterium]|nr:ATP-grasp domain-containing protein [Gammaproteobacteria bacterium]MBU0787417.1 ATP-grasp domain-containing protein [Gammaproteobacteria bacterium]MBU0815113.1 ATP-grasp domain-containing protein [Gammaproteobacteria bacterium]MBU1785779.1 ATP-grasp domain-containing protein [Gammaproteobacteria bacterium]
MRCLLIANRGEIARRIIRSAHAMGLRTVAVYSEADADALHVQEASCAVALGGTRSADSYLRIDKLLAAARASGADAVHPGYGFLSENADFAQVVLDAGLTWVGPPPAAIRALGNKASAKALAQQHGVPCLPGYQGEDQSDARLIEEAGHLGYPLMVKAAAGGGGRGMRLVLAAAQLPAALQSARSEALSSFGSGELLLERALLQPRHVEVQVFADAHGHCIHLGERDCSVQRRHQKLVEESPSPAVDAALRARMGQCAVALAQAAGYVGAGTVEFLVEQKSGGESEFFLMEMNTRLQVEHPVTEMVTGLDLVEWQLRVAQGEPLPLTQEQVRFSGHAIEVRLCAEDDDFAPHAGRVLHFKPPQASATVRFDHALRSGLQVSPYYDSMLGKLIVHGANRQEAIDRLVAALADTQLLGLPTNRAFLSACLDHPVFRAGQALIPFLQEHGDAIRQTLQAAQMQLLLPATVAMHFGAASGAAQALPSPFAKALRVRHREQLHALSLGETGQSQLELIQGEQAHAADCHRQDAHSLQVSIDGLSQSVQACQVTKGRWHVQAAATDLWLEDASFEPAAGAGSASQAMELRAPFNGKLIAIKVAAGAPVKRGDTLLVIESMKLEHAICATHDAVVAGIAVELGQQTAPGQILLRFEP